MSNISAMLTKCILWNFLVRQEYATEYYYNVLMYGVKYMNCALYKEDELQRKLATFESYSAPRTMYYDAHLFPTYYIYTYNYIHFLTVPTYFVNMC